ASSRANAIPAGRDDCNSTVARWSRPCIRPVSKALMTRFSSALGSASGSGSKAPINGRPCGEMNKSKAIRAEHHTDLERGRLACEEKYEFPRGENKDSFTSGTPPWGKMESAL